MLVPFGESYTFSASPDTDYVVDRWYVDGVVAQIGGTSYTLSEIKAAHDVKVTFRNIYSTYTVSFAAGPGGSISGATPQILAYGGSCSPVTATADARYHFVNWTGSLTTANNPLTVENVMDNMDVTANFAHDTVQMTMSVSPPRGGNASPAGTTVVDTAVPTVISAAAATGFTFVNWDASPADNAVFGDASSADTTVTLSADAAVTANFAINSYTITFTAGQNGSLIGQTTQTADYGASCAPVTAVPDSGYCFKGWTGDYRGMKNPLVIAPVTKDMTITAEFVALPAATDMCYGKKYALDASAGGLANFASLSKVYTLYVDPLKGGAAKKASLKVLDKIVKGAAPLFVNCQWTRFIILFDKKLWAKTLTCEQNIALRGTIEPLPTALFVTGKEATGKVVTDQDTRIVMTLVPPEITGVYDVNEGMVFSTTTGQTLTLRGLFFGTTPPVAWMEYPVYDSQGQVKEIKMLKLKLSKPLKYADAKNVIGRSCMDVETGLSEITVFTPAAWPKGWDHGVGHNIVIDNKIGRATITFRTEK